MKINFNEMSDEDILEFVENLTDDEFEALDEEARVFLEKYLDESEDEASEETEETEAEVEAVEEEVEETEQVDEETEAAATLHPGKGSSGGMTKAETLSALTGLAANLSSNDLSDLYYRTVEKYNPSTDDGKNKASIAAKASAAIGKSVVGQEPMPKISIKEDMDSLFESVDLPEEFKNQFEVVLEAAINTKYTLIEETLSEQFDAIVESLEAGYAEKLDEEIEAILEGLTEKLEQYLDHVTDVFMEENEVAINNTLRMEIAEDFLEGMKNLFAENYIEVPSDRLDIVADLSEQVELLSAKLEEATDQNIELSAIIEESLKSEILADMCEGLTKTQVEKLRSLSEGLEFTDGETYAKKLDIIKENYFGDKIKSSGTGLITESIDGEEINEETDKHLTSNIRAYVDTLSKFKN